MTHTSIDAAYRLCEEITQTQARNFSYGIRLLPADKRRALSAVYSVARRIDDIGDGPLPASERQVLLEDVRRSLHRFPDAGDADPTLSALADAAQRMPIPLGAFDELIDGCLADVRGHQYETAEDLIHYCQCVAGSVGRLSLGVFGTSDPGRASTLANALGIALQLTNILRDLLEDRCAGRIYLPAEDLNRFGCALRLDGGRLVDPPDRLAALIGYEAGQAQRWYDAGLRLLPMLDRRSAACTAAMAGIYRRLLARIAEDPISVARTRMALPRREKAWVAAKALVGGMA